MALPEQEFVNIRNKALSFKAAIYTEQSIIYRFMILLFVVSIIQKKFQWVEYTYILIKYNMIVTGMVSFNKFKALAATVSDDVTRI